jgi:hypothetical protein
MLVCGTDSAGSGQGLVSSSSEHCDELLDSKKVGRLLYQLKTCHLFNKQLCDCISFFV